MVFICDDPPVLSRVRGHFIPAGYSLIHYANPLKAMDNFRETAPDVVLFQTRDFPRHWKLALQFLRESFNKEESLFILLTEENFDKEEMEKAHFLKVTAIFPEEKPMEELESTILRYKISPSTRTRLRLLPSGRQKMDFMFMNPENLQLINARVLELSEKGAAIKVEDTGWKDCPIPEGKILKNCSLNTGQNIVDLDVRVEEARTIMVINFLDKPAEWQKEIRKALTTLT